MGKRKEKLIIFIRFPPGRSIFGGFCYFIFIFQSDGKIDYFLSSSVVMAAAPLNPVMAFSMIVGLPQQSMDLADCEHDFISYNLIGKMQHSCFFYSAIVYTTNWQRFFYFFHFLFLFKQISRWTKIFTRQFLELPRQRLIGVVSPPL